MDSEITKELESTGFDSEGSENDRSQVDFTYVWKQRGRRPMSFSFNKLSPLNAIRILENWEVTGTSHYKHGGGTIPFSLSLDHSKNIVTLKNGVPEWEVPLSSPSIKVLNSASTGELLVKFLAPVLATNDPLFTMHEGSYVYIQDSVSHS